ncbi:hypothetical protein Entas_4641 (plasmid) [Enterobacter soli]|nr:hypothetical protein Entas_4641 [Enterobacter soli]
MVSPLVRLRHVNSAWSHSCNPAIFHAAQSDEVLLSFSSLATAPATEKTRRAVRAEFPIYGYM